MDCAKNKQHLNTDTTSQDTSARRQHLHTKVNSSLPTPQGPQCNERGDSRADHMTNVWSGGIFSLPTLPGTAREPQCKVMDRNIPESQPTAGPKYTIVKHSASVSQTSISSSPPPKIFTPADDSSSGRSFSDLSIASLQVQETYDLLNVANGTGSKNPQAQANAVHPSAADGMHHLYHSLSTMDYLIGGDDLNNTKASPDINLQIHSDVDFESFIHSEGFLPQEQSGNDSYNLGIADDIFHPPNSINPRRLSKTPFAEPLTSSQNWTATSGSSQRKEASGKQKSVDESQTAPMLAANLSSPVSTARYGGSYCPGVEGNNRPARVCPAPIKTGTTRSLSGRSTYSCNTTSSSISGESNNTVIRRTSATSTKSQDSKYSLLNRGRSAHRREDTLLGISRRDSTNSSTSQESQRDIPDGGDWHGAHSSGLRENDLSDTTQTPSSSDRESFPGRRESYCDDAQASPGRIRRRHAFSFDYKGRPLTTHRNTFSKNGHMEQDQTVDHLTSELRLVHI
jgi:hypothetical protein